MIFDACKQGYLVEEIFDYINQGGTFNIKKRGNYTPLHLACKCNHLDIVKFLLAHNADINATMEGLFTPLHCSVLSHNVAMTKLLLNAGADINAQTTPGDTALDLAYIIKNETIKKAIIELFAFNMLERSLANIPNVDTTLIESLTPLHCAVSLENVMMTQYLLHVGADIDVQTIDGDTALDLACYIEDKSVKHAIIRLFPVDKVRFFFELKAATRPKSFSPLHRAVLRQDIQKIQELLNTKIDLDEKTIENDTALDLACYIKNETIIELFPTQSSEESSS